MTYMVQLDMYGQHAAKDGRHPQQVMSDIGVGYKIAVPQSIGDCWQFFGVAGDAVLPHPWLTMKEVNPMDYIGWGMSEKQAKSLLAE